MIKELIYNLLYKVLIKHRKRRVVIKAKNKLSRQPIHFKVGKHFKCGCGSTKHWGRGLCQNCYMRMRYRINGYKYHNKYLIRRKLHD